MKDQKINLKEKEFLANIEEFFEARTVNNHLLFIDHWIGLMLGGKKSSRWAKPGDLYYSYQKIEELFQCCNQLLLDHQIFAHIQDSTAVKSQSIAYEKHALKYFPYQLTKKELLNPTNVIRGIFKHKNLMYYQQTLKEWVAAGLGNSYAAENADYIIPLYGNMKKLIEACWLIHERVVSKNSFIPVHYPEPLLNYALTEPNLFNKEEADDPFLMVEEFFELTNLSGYRQELQEWYFLAITTKVAAKKPIDVYFIHNQYSSLIQAGFLITAKNLYYTPKICKNSDSTMGQWLLSVRDHEAENGVLVLSDEAPHVLTMSERADPLAYCKKTLTHENVVKIRFGLKEWLYAGLSSQSRISDFENINPFELYLTLQKLTEAFYLIITANAEEHILPLTNTSYEV